ncbi:MerR family transcriptional regulator [Bacillus atrophaeus]|jgi:effector-binding domain-containing protein|uniref:Transcriptional regulator n=4 Tax=Bacillus atrophaeus TaxID=1452 RepID=A0ABM5LWZ2_BACA1|nr:MerR family transcriptional regulator [Bacillus atrophaeus]AMR62805.1 BltR family transcriptional regulator [Bacillus subtilis subsp. globigii]ADP32309.1 transcriptional regulator [Bacillus atrophaeus 1942]AIK46305.1 merR regulatory family protein [Bacillus atrophaeus subsp. globigii]EIM08985.1 transcriptional regulator [Bacillus atrophaeus C89]KFK82433.1 merR regulatory family protein [Bacillus atrophaeus]
MSEDIKKYFTTGEFAKLCHVKKQTLFHYDEIGLFSPEIKKENGYRYYSYNQFELFQVIGLFKEVGVPLKRIKQLLKGKTPEDIVALLKEKSFEIENKIKKFKHLQTIIQTKVKLTEQALETDFSSVSFQYLEEEKFMISRNTLNLPERKYIAAISELIRYVQLHELDEGYPVGGIFAREQILKKDFYNYSHFYIKVQEGIEKINYHVRPKGLYAVGYQKGDEAEDAYRRIIQFIEKNRMRMGEYAYEEYMLDEVVVDGLENQITKILLQVKEGSG